MVWVKFRAKFTYKPTLQTSIEYPAGCFANVTTPCARAAIAAGVAVEESPPPRKPSAQVKARLKAPDA